MAGRYYLNPESKHKSGTEVANLTDSCYQCQRKIRVRVPTLPAQVQYVHFRLEPPIGAQCLTRSQHVYT